MAENIKFFYFNHLFPPVHYLQIVIPKGSLSEPVEKKGIMEILSENLFIYSKKYKEELKPIFDRLGANFDISVSEEATLITLKVIKENFEKALSILLDFLHYPAFKEKNLKSSKKQAIGNLKISLTDPQIVSEMHLFDFVFGKENPLGKSQTPKTTKNIKLKDLISQYERLKDTRNWGIFISSPEEEGKIKEKIFRTLSKYELKNLDLFELKEVKLELKPKVRIIPKKDMTQVSINLLIPAFPRTSIDYIPLKTSFYSLAEGGFSSRILREIRVEMSSTYGVLGSYDAFKDIGYLQISGMVKNNDFQKTVEIIEKLYKEWKNEGINVEELEEAKQFYLNSFKTIKDDPLEWGSFLLKNHIQDLPENYYEILIERIKNLRLEDIKEVNKKLLEEIPFWVFLGEEKIIKPVAEMVGEFEIKSYYDI